MSAAPDPIWRAHDDNGRPVHNATLTVFTEANEIADTWLDPAYTKRGCNPRFSNIRGEFCNSSADGTPAGLHLKPGTYTVIIADRNGHRLGSPIRITVKPEGGGQVIEVRPAPPSPPAAPITVIAAGHGEIPQALPVGIAVHGSPSQEAQRIARDLSRLPPEDQSHISKAIRQLLEGSGG